MKENYESGIVIDGVEVITPTTHQTLDGTFQEVFRFANEKELQINLSELEPQSIKAWHYHNAPQIDYFFPLDKLIIGLYDTREGSPTLGVAMRIPAHRQIVKIPPLVLHSVWNPGYDKRSLLYFVTYFFNGGDNEFRQQWDLLGLNFFKVIPS